jgi:hypothetical protein
MLANAGRVSLFLIKWIARPVNRVSVCAVLISSRASLGAEPSTHDLRDAACTRGPRLHRVGWRMKIPERREKP